MKKREITNEEFEAARRLYRPRMKVAQRYANSLSPEQITACCDMALWRCMRQYDPTFGQSIESSLHRFIHWECLNAIREMERSPVPLSDDVEGHNETLAINMILEDYLSLLDERDRRMVEARYLESCTLQEIAVREGFSRQGVKNIVDRSVATMTEAALAV